MRSGVVILIAVVVPEIMPGKWHFRCFAKCPYRAHRWDIRQGAQEGIWRYCGKLPIRGPNSWRLAWHQRSSGSMPFEYAVDGSTSQTHTGSNNPLLNTLKGKCKHLMPNTHKGWTGHCSNNQKNFWKNMQILIQSCHSVKIDLGEWPPILWFRSSTIPLDLALNVCPR